MRAFNYSTLLLFSALSFGILGNSCKKKSEKSEPEEKQPAASFSTDKAEYLEGETITLTSTSSDADSYRWTMPDGQTQKGGSATYQVEVLSFDRSLQFKLEAISKSGTKSDYAIKNVPVKAKTGKLVLYDGYYPNASTIYIDGVSMGPVVLPASFPNPPVIPACGQSGYPTYTLKTGTHVIMVTGMQTWTKTFEIKHNECLVIQLYNS